MDEPPRRAPMNAEYARVPALAAEVEGASERTAHQMRDTKHRPDGDRHWREALVCVVLHVLLVLIHVALFVVISHHYEHGFTMSITKATTTWAPLVVGTIQQTFGTVYTAVLVLLTQRVALRNDLHRRQTLTAVHDKNTAWLGLGAALGAMWHQTRLRAAPWAVCAIALYLACVFVLHISVAGLFHVVPYNATVPQHVQTKLANANYTANMVSAYDVLLTYNQIQKVGLLDTMVYDIIPALTSATGNTTVNASVYDVQCMAMPDLGRNPAFDGPTGSTSPVSYFTIGETGAYMQLGLPYYQAIYGGIVFNISKTPNGAERCDQTNCWAPLVFGSTVSIVDASGSEGPTATGNPWIDWGAGTIQSITDPADYSLALTYMMTAVQTVGCSVDIKDMQINVSTTTLQPFEGPQPVRGATWKNLSWPEDRTRNDPRLLAAQNAPALSPASGHQNTLRLTWDIIPNLNASQVTGPVQVVSPDGTFFPSPADQLEEQIVYSNTSQIVSRAPTAFDSFVTAELGIAAMNRTSVTLDDLNWSIARALAAVHWYGQNIAYSNSQVIDNGLLQSPLTKPNPLIINTQQNPITEFGDAVIMIAETRYQLSLSLAPLIVGTVASAILLIIAVLLIRPPVRSTRPSTAARAAAIDSAGILQITWLLGNEEHLATVQVPEVETLRAAGMFEVEMNRGERGAAYALKNETSDTVDPYTPEEVAY